MSQLPRVTVLGSCRVANPFALLARSDRIELHNRGVCGFVNGAPEVLQQLRVMAGEGGIPIGLAPYVWGPPAQAPGPDGRLPVERNDLSETDVLVVELSSLKQIELDGTFLHAPLLRSEMTFRRPRVAAWLAALHDGTEAPEEREAYLEDGLSASEIEIVLRSRLSTQTPQAVATDMRRIAGRFRGPVLWVCHFDSERAPRTTGRARAAAAVRAGARTLGQPCFDPGPLVRAAGETRVLRDRAHYTSAFDRALGPVLLSLVERLVRRHPG